jgi:hypothetical protein
VRCGEPGSNTAKYQTKAFPLRLIPFHTLPRTNLCCEISLHFPFQKIWKRVPTSNYAANITAFAGSEGLKTLSRTNLRCEVALCLPFQKVRKRFPAPICATKYHCIPRFRRSENVFPHQSALRNSTWWSRFRRPENAFPHQYVLRNITAPPVSEGLKTRARIKLRCEYHWICRSRRSENVFPQQRRTMVGNHI